MSKKSRWTLGGAPVVAALAAMALAPQIASAAPVLVSRAVAAPDGTGTSCSQEKPCSLATAIASAGAGDEVIVTPGDYASAAAPLTTPLANAKGINVHGVDDQPRPRIFTTAGVGLDVTGAGTKVRHLEIQQSAGATPSQQALIVDGQASDLVVRATGAGAKACTVLGASVLTNSVCEATGLDGGAVFPYRLSTAPAANTSTIRNVTAVASGKNGSGISALGGIAPADAQSLTVTNTIVVVPGGNPSITAFKQTGGADAKITIDHSNFGIQGTDPDRGGQIVKGDGNQQLGPAPRFRADGDFHQAPDSPTIDKGATDPLNGAFDVDGDPRSVGLGTDIGADEFVPEPPAPTTDPGDAGDAGDGNDTPAAPSEDAAGARTKPRFVGKLAVSTRKKAITFRLSERATVRFTVQRAVRDRRGRTRFVAQRGSLTVKAKAGANRVRFAGRLGKKALPAGRFRLVATATDAAGNRSKAKRATFTIARR
jgi:hypothetical protein